MSQRFWRLIDNLMRSKLFVPGSRPELFSKALTGGADGLSFDLEDSVREDRKAEARANLASFLIGHTVAKSSKTIVVRVNPLDTPHFVDDLAAVVCANVHLINLPKAEHPDQIRMAARQLAELERDKGLNVNGRTPIGLLVNIETPRSLRIAHDLAAADPRVHGLQLGLGDLFEPYGIDRRQVIAVQQAMFLVAMAAHEVGIRAYDGAFANVANIESFKTEAELAKSFGFHGKSCIHPSQVGTANAVFQPSAEEIAYSQRVILAEAQALEKSVGAFLVDGKMIDKPFVDRAKHILSIAQQQGMVDK